MGWLGPNDDRGAASNIPANAEDYERWPCSKKRSHPDGQREDRSYVRGRRPTRGGTLHSLRSARLSEKGARQPAPPAEVSAQATGEEPALHVANLQLEGLMMAVAFVNQALVRKGILSIDEIDIALRKAEASFTSDERLFEDMEPVSRDAVCFPIRLLQLANLGQSENSVQTFS